MNLLEPKVRGKNIQHGGYDEQPFTEETAMANAAHDRKYGWEKGHSKTYSNQFRLPEYHFACPWLDDQSIWDWINGQ